MQQVGATQTPRQERAVRTRRRILEAAGHKFDANGFKDTTIEQVLNLAGVTRGAFFYHFKSKKLLALAVIEEQIQDISVPPQRVKLQEFVDAGYLLAHRLRGDPIARGANRLAMDQGSDHLNSTESMDKWTDFVVELLTEARKREEILEWVAIRDTAELFVTSFAGIQHMSRAKDDRKTLGHRLTHFWKHTLPTVATSAALAHLVIHPDRALEILDVTEVVAE
ncbi:ScbR family autoregulator-binding transcription factor [Streptomyces sp. MS1.AVA.3]|uniref:ScbR family autoregulator-binding transcription factor n=1 Tax=Streptomyces decoyicus TaxID=249567 RepID=UPI0030BF80F4